VIRPGISPETLTKLNIRHVSAEEAKKLVGQNHPGIFIPYGILDQDEPFGRIRLDVPQDDRKYTQRFGSGVHPYLAGLHGMPPADDLVVVEGEFKAISLCEAGFPAVGISGFYGYAKDGQLCPEFVQCLRTRSPKRILFLGDNDTALNYQFSDAAIKLAKLVGPIPVSLPRIPISMPKGVDDCRESLGEKFSEWWMSIVAQSIALPAKLKADLLAVELLKMAAEDIRKLS